jgi:hypothetical protein
VLTGAAPERKNNGERHEIYHPPRGYWRSLCKIGGRPVIIRTPKAAEYEAKYARIDNRFLTDPRLTFKAKGIGSVLLSKPDGWEIMLQHLVNMGPDGRTSVESGLAELKEYGYLTFGDQPRGAGGRFDAITTFFHEEPVSGFPCESPETQVVTDAENQQRLEAQVVTDADCPRAGNPRPDNPRAEKPRRVTTHSTTTEKATTEPEREGASARRPRATLIPDDFVASHELRLWADEQGLDAHRLGAEVEKFVAYYRSKGERRVDWSAALQAWMLKCKDFERTPSHRNQQASRTSFLVERMKRNGDFEPGGFLDRMTPKSGPTFDFEAECVGEELLDSPA